jgi:hypothetical protein
MHLLEVQRVRQTIGVSIKGMVLLMFDSTFLAVDPVGKTYALTIGKKRRLGGVHSFLRNIWKLNMQTIIWTTLTMRYARKSSNPLAMLHLQKRTTSVSMNVS